MNDPEPTVALDDCTKGKMIVENESLRLALEFYANKKNWQGHFPFALADEGERARQVLAELEDD